MQNDLFSKIDFDIKEGRKYKATLRLRNLINEYPDELNLRNQLADLYYQSGFYDEAGKFWILSETINPEISKCIEIYKNSVNNSGNQILKDIVFRGDKNKLSINQQTILKELEKNSLEKTKTVPNFQKKKNQKNLIEYKETSKDRLIIYLFLIIIIFIVLLLILGIIKIIEWF
ncbi:hypothetical protein SAMN05421738_102305 [Algoriella xinjiangensis]|uniref:Tetratricopeptide repeat-containing protein n=1 Tax=Algoriella xinjiangensis TaxID=684065 RepID=A0A1I4TQC5_9FLAO|nr:DUF6584 family protein [Algoriella xinjiangensis]SFM78875.1 hypothetical protein SAMN05421738_102305 [Algoriella xinjiangensis]VDH14857.1 Uncharacterised protein [Algoriella xinjiangensis]